MIPLALRLAARRPRTRPGIVPSAGGSSFLVLLLILPLGSPAPARAQSGWIVVSEPREWSDNQRLSAPVDARVRVVGQAFHPDGIESVLIGPEPAELGEVAGGVVEFRGYVAVRAGMGGVTIEAHPPTGEPLIVMFAVATTAPEAGPEGAAPVRADPPVPVEPVPVEPERVEPERPGRDRPEPGEAAASPTGPTSGAEVRHYSPGVAALGSLVVPGLGQLYTGRKLRGVLFLGAAAGAIATGLLSEETTVQCLEPLTDGECPSGAVHSEEVDKPYLVAGLAGAGAVALLAALDGYLGAKRLNRAAVREARPGTARPLDRLGVGAARGGVRVGVRIPF